MELFFQSLFNGVFGLLGVALAIVMVALGVLILGLGSIKGARSLIRYTDLEIAGLKKDIREQIGEKKPTGKVNGK